MWATGLACASVLVVVGIASLHDPGSAAWQLGHHSLPADLALRDTIMADLNSQASFITALQTQDPTARGSAISDAQAFGQTADASWATYESHALNGRGEAAYQQTYEATAARGRQLGAQLVAMSPSSPQYAATLAAERSQYVAEVAALTQLESTFYAPLVRVGGQTIGSDIARARTVVLAGFALLASLFTVLALALTRGGRRYQRSLTAEAEALRAAQEQAEFDASLQSALEMAPNEETTVQVVEQALAMIAPGTPAELLLADSSHAHFRQVLTTDPAADAGCQVGSPRDCPTATGGHTRVFVDSSHLSTCRFLRGRADPVWAVCVPVSIAGRTTGIIRTQRALDQPLSDRLPVTLEVVARKTGDRIGALRVLARTEAQAQTDPLTGLPNRRTLDNRMHDLLVENPPYVVAYADLDHFKAINDTHGHDTGDRALRLFARVLRDNVRPRDLVARHGGEEFLVVLPECSLDDARALAERLRSELARTLAQAAVPSFTVTVGLASSEPGDAFSEVVARADATMLKAKALGRDRVLAAGDPTVSAEAVTSQRGGVAERRGEEARVVASKGSF